MQPFNLTIFVLGCLGGLLPDILRLIKNRYEAPAKFYSYPTFWLGLTALIVIGGFSAWLGGATEVKDALAFGFAAPEIFSKLFSEKGEAVDRGEGNFYLKRWWKG